MSVDWDGRIRMDPSSTYAMQSLIGLKDRFDIAFACDTDHDRHGIVTRSAGLLPPNHYLAVAIDYLFRHRPLWKKDAAIGKTVVSSQMIDRVGAKLGRKLYEVPVGFKWFVDGLLDGSLGFAGEESAGAAFLRIDGTVWTTDKDGIVPALLSAEITAETGRDPGELYRELVSEFGESAYDRVDRPGDAGAEKVAGQTLAHPGALDGTGRRKDPAHAGRCAGQRRAHRRIESDDQACMVRRAPLGHREPVQDLCRELQRGRPLAPRGR